MHLSLARNKHTTLKSSKSQSNFPDDHIDISFWRWGADTGIDIKEVLENIFSDKPSMLSSTWQ
jgi:hypothetical protein